MIKKDEIIEGCKNGDTSSQTTFYNKYKTLLTNVARRYFRDPDSVDEVVQTTFIYLYENLHKYNYSGSFEGWIQRIMRNKCIDYLRILDKLPKAVGVGGGEMNKLGERNGHDECYDSIVRKENARELNTKAKIVLAEVNKLSPAYRMAFTNYVIEDMTHIESAEEMEVSHSTAKANYCKAKINLRKRLELQNITL